MQRRWKEVGNAEFKRDPEIKERKELTDLLLELLEKEQREGPPGAAKHHKLASGELVMQCTQTHIAFKDIEYYAEEHARRIE